MIKCTEKPSYVRHLVSAAVQRVQERWSALVGAGSVIGLPSTLSPAQRPRMPGVRLLVAID